jgi:ATP-dependent Clp protease ATP-binding subunit ClpA
VKLLRCGRARATTFPAEPSLRAGAAEARRRGHGYVGTEHLLLALIGDRAGDAGRILSRLGVSPSSVEDALASAVKPSRPRIDPSAVASLGIDFETVRERLEETFGPGALERTSAGCLRLSPRLKHALASAVELAGEKPLADGDVLIGMLSVRDSVAARVLADFGVSLDAAVAVAYD